jgi:hypothetical protein
VQHTAHTTLQCGFLLPKTATLHKHLQEISIDPNIDISAVESWSAAVEDVFWPKSKGKRSDFYDQFPGIKIYFLTPNSIDNAIAESVSSNYPLVIGAGVLIAAFVIAVLFVRGRAFVRSLLGLVGLLGVALAIGAGFGIALFIGLPFTTVTQVLPFILLGVGVDDMFMLVQSLEEVDEVSPGLPIEDRFRQCLEKGGMSITVTSLTNATAFLFGSMTSIPAIRWCGARFYRHQASTLPISNIGIPALFARFSAGKPATSAISLGRAPKK